MSDRPGDRPDDSGPVLGMVTIGQSPRDDVLSDMADRLPGDAHVLQRGALDDLDNAALARLTPCGSEAVLVTRLRDGTEQAIAQRLVTALLQRAIDKMLAATTAPGLIAVLCTGSIDGLRSAVPLLFPGPLVRTVAAREVAGGKLGVVVPSADQAAMAMREWQAADATVFVVAASPYAEPRQLEHAAATLARWRPDLVVLDCIGFTSAMRDIVSDMLKVPVVLPRAVLADAMSDALRAMRRHIST